MGLSTFSNPPSLSWKVRGDLYLSEGKNLELLGKSLPLLAFVNKPQNLRKVYLNCHDLSSICLN